MSYRSRRSDRGPNHYKGPRRYPSDRNQQEDLFSRSNSAFPQSRHSSNGSRFHNRSSSSYNRSESGSERDNRRSDSRPERVKPVDRPHSNGNSHPKETTYLIEPYKNQKHHKANLVISPSTEIKKSYKIVYDPDLSKSKSEGLAPKYVKNESTTRPPDPRLSLPKYPIYEHNTKLSKKTLYRELKRTRFVHDQNSVGPPPDNEVLIWGFAISTSESLIKNNLRTFGQIEAASMVVDKETGAPLGVYRLKFSGSPDKSASIARIAIKEIDRKMKLNGNTIRSSLNSADNRILHDLVQSKLGEKRRQLKLQEQKQAKEAPVAPKPTPKGPKGSAHPAKKPPSLIEVGSHEVKALFNEPSNNAFLPQASQTVVSKSITNHIKNADYFTVSDDLKDFIRGRPFIFLSAKNAPISVANMKTYLKDYNYTRVLTDSTGFYIVFKCLKYANSCFRSEFGKEITITSENARKIHCTMKLVLVVAPDWEDLFTGSEIISDSRKFLLNDLKLKLIKDVSDEMNSTIMELLDPKNFPEEMAKLREAAERKKAAAPATTRPDGLLASNPFSTDNVSIDGEIKLFNFKKSVNGTKRDRSGKLNRKKRFDMMPMSHALNYNSDEESKSLSIEETPAPESESEDEDNVESGTEVKGGKSNGTAALKKAKIEIEVKPELDLDNDVTMKDEFEPELKEEELKIEPVSDFDTRYKPVTHLPQPAFDPSNDDFEFIDLTNAQSLIKDEEDLLLTKEIFKEVETTSKIKNLEYWAWRQKDLRIQDDVFEEFNVTIGNVLKSEENEILDSSFQNVTGSWKSEGFKKIPDKKKSAYLPHKRRLDQPLNTVEHAGEEMTHQNSTSTAGNNGNQTGNNVQSSRVNRANNRRLAADIKSISTETDLLELNQLAKRKKPVSFARSAIHNWGLYALEPISAGEMIIEYVGDRIRQQVAEVREKKYLKSGIGSSYLFRIDENTVIDATKKGGIARFINHCCSPSCTAKIIKVEGKKRIVIYALRDIAMNEELTYDYKFERETNNDERIPCLCGAPGCKGFLN